MTGRGGVTKRSLVVTANCCLGAAATVGLFTVMAFVGAGFRLYPLMLFPAGFAVFAAVLSIAYRWAVGNVGAKPAAEPPRAALITRSDVKLSSVGLSNGAKRARSAVPLPPARPRDDNPTTRQLTSGTTESEVEVR